MKNRALAATFLGLSIFVHSALAEPSIQAKNAKQIPNQESGPDLSQSGWQGWQAPVGTVDPSRLISSDSTNPVASEGLSQKDPDALRLASGGKPIQVEEKPIENVEAGTSSPNEPAAESTPAAKTKSGSGRIVVVAALGVAVFGYRRLRRGKASPYPPKPNFL